MNDFELFEALRDLVRSVARIDPSVPMTPESTLVEDLGVDSLDLVSVYLQVQDDFDVVVGEEDVAGIRTLGELARYVADQRPAKVA